MARRLIRYAFASLIIFASIIGRAQNPGTIVRVLDQSGEGIPGVVLLVSQGYFLDSQVFISDAHGEASVPHLKCSICTITGMDPRGLFLSKTAEFDSRSLSVTLFLEVGSVIDRVGIPGSIKVNVTVYGPAGEPLPNQRVVVRPTVMTLDPDTNWFYLDTTDSKGLISVERPPGEYIVATFLGEKLWEATLRIQEDNLKCAAKARKCFDTSLFAVHPEQFISAHLSAVRTTLR